MIFMLMLNWLQFLPYFMTCFNAKFHILCHFCLCSSVSIKIFFEVFLLIICPYRIWNINLIFVIFFQFIILFIWIYFRLWSKHTLYFYLCPYKVCLLYFLCYLIPTSSRNNTFNQSWIITSANKNFNFVLIFLRKL